jgi:hypothetical protein
VSTLYIPNQQTSSPSMPRMVPSAAEAAPCGPKICMSSKHIDVVMQQTSSSYYHDCEHQKMK